MSGRFISPTVTTSSYLIHHVSTLTHFCSEGLSPTGYPELTKLAGLLYNRERPWRCSRARVWYVIGGQKSPVSHKSSIFLSSEALLFSQDDF